MSWTLSQLEHASKMSNLIDHRIFGFGAPGDQDEFVGHFTSATTLDHIVASKAFKLSRLATLNDPREYRDRTYSIVTGALDDRQREDLRLALSAARANTRAGSFTSDATEGTTNSLLRADGRAFARQAMWSHYAARHTGVCIVFRRAAIERQLESAFAGRWSSGPIDYVPGYESGWDVSVFADDNGALTTAELVKRHERETIHDSLLVKNRDWSAEREWRALVLDHDESVDALLPLEGAPSPVAALVLGEDFAPSGLDSARHFAEEFGLLENVAVARLVGGVIITLPIDKSSTEWRFYSDDELKAMGRNNIR